MSDRKTSWGRRAGWLAVGGIAALALGRALGYLVYAACQATTPLESFFLESKMVHLAWRAREGVRLYPPWRDGPHVANFFGPVYFGLVGLLGRLADVGLDGMFPLARAVTLTSSLGTTLLLGLVARRRYGAGAGLLAAVVSLGSGPMIGFGVMARPDALADLLGLAGFLAAIGPTRRGVWAGGLLLLAAGFTKQTAAVYLVAAVLANHLAGRRATALAIGGLVAAVSAVLVVGITTLVEPEFGPGLLGESRSPWDLHAYHTLLGRLARDCPDLLVFSAIGIALWSLGPTRDIRLVALTVSLLATGLVTAGKKGADLNYFLGLRSIEALAAAALWSALRTAERSRAWALAAAATLAAAAMVPSAADALAHGTSSFRFRQFLATSRGRAILRDHADLIRLAGDPRSRVLTDSGLLDIRRGAKSDFADPWLFRLLVETGRIDPAGIRRKIDREEYDWIVTTKPLSDPEYASYEFGLPMTLVEPARRHYAPYGQRAGLFLARPRGRPVAP